MFTVLRVIDTNQMGIAFVLDTDRRVIGVVTDGDIRHAFVRGINLHDEVRQAMSHHLGSRTARTQRNPTGSNQKAPRGLHPTRPVQRAPMGPARPARASSS